MSAVGGAGGGGSSVVAAGSNFGTLSEVLDHYAAGGRTISGRPNAGVGRASRYKSPFLIAFVLTAQDREDVIAFLESLTDPMFLSDPQFSDPWPRGGLKTDSVASLLGGQAALVQHAASIRFARGSRTPILTCPGSPKLSASRIAIPPARRCATSSEAASTL